MDTEQQPKQLIAFRVSEPLMKRFSAILKREDREKGDMLRRVFEAGLKAFERQSR